MNQNNEKNKSTFEKEIGNLLDSVEDQLEKTTSQVSSAKTSSSDTQTSDNINTADTKDIKQDSKSDEKAQTKKYNAVSPKDDNTAIIEDEPYVDKRSSEELEMFNSLFDDIKQQQQKERKDMHTRRLQKIKRMQEKRSPELAEKLRQASDMDGDIVDFSFAPHKQKNTGTPKKKPKKKIRRNFGKKILKQIVAPQLRNVAGKISSGSAALKQQLQKRSMTDKSKLKEKETPQRPKQQLPKQAPAAKSKLKEKETLQKPLQQPDNEPLKSPPQRDVFKNIINDEYESIVQIPAKKFLNSKSPYQIVLRANLDSLLYDEISEFFDKDTDKAEKPKKDEAASEKKWAKLENMFFEENNEKEPEELPKKKVHKAPDITEYNSKEDEPAIEKMLFKSKYNLIFQTICLGLLFFIAFVFVCIKRFDTQQPIIGNSILYIVSQLIPLILGIIVAKKTVLNGIRSLFRLKKNSDVAISLSCFITIIHSVLAIINIDQFSSMNINIYTIIPLFALLLNSFGKLNIVQRIFSNFKFLKLNPEKYAVKMCPVDKISNKQKKDSEPDDAPVIAYREKMNFLNNFLKYSYQPDISEIISGKTVYIGVILSA
ncbi:MAG: hypothetical protein Q4B14_06775, partial [Clostridia bacterium]|nr:hypothetical protein [Clostridia bacterium]